MTVGALLIADNVAALSVGKAGWFYKSHLYIGSIPIIGGFDSPCPHPNFIVGYLIRTDNSVGRVADF